MRQDDHKQLLTERRLNLWSYTIIPLQRSQAYTLFITDNYYDLANCSYLLCWHTNAEHTPTLLAVQVNITSTCRISTSNVIMHSQCNGNLFKCHGSAIELQDADSLPPLEGGYPPPPKTKITPVQKAKMVCVFYSEAKQGNPFLILS